MTRVLKLALTLSVLAAAGSISAAAFAEHDAFPATGASWRATAERLDPVAFQRLVIGMPKRQIYHILGAPHFNEGFGTRHWNYWYVSPRGESCQLRIDFDRDKRIQALAWSSEGCQSAASAR